MGFLARLARTEEPFIPGHVFEAIARRYLRTPQEVDGVWVKDKLALSTEDSNKAIELLGKIDGTTRTKQDLHDWIVLLQVSFFTLNEFETQWSITDN